MDEDREVSGVLNDEFDYDSGAKGMHRKIFDVPMALVRGAARQSTESWEASTRASTRGSCRSKKVW